MYLEVVHMKYKGVSQWGVAGRIYKGKLPTGCPRGLGYFQKEFSYTPTKRFLYFFPLTLNVFWSLSPKHSKTFHIAHFHIFISLLTLFLIHIFDGRRDHFCHCLALVVQWAPGCTIWAERKPIPFLQVSQTHFTGHIKRYVSIHWQ